MGLWDNVAALQQFILLCSFQVPVEAKWSLLVHL